MILRDVIDRHIGWRQDHGARFDTTGHMLHCFCRYVGEHIRCDAVTEADVLRFLVGNGPLTRYRANKYSALTGFYRYAISRGYAERSPLPVPESEPRKPSSAPPYVFTHDGLQRLLPALSTWLGHAHLDGTQVYLSMTPELLHEASVRFHGYVNGEDHE